MMIRMKGLSGCGGNAAFVATILIAVTGFFLYIFGTAISMRDMEAKLNKAQNAEKLLQEQAVVRGFAVWRLKTDANSGKSEVVFEWLDKSAVQVENKSK